MDKLKLDGNKGVYEAYNTYGAPFCFEWKDDGDEVTFSNMSTNDKSYKFNIVMKKEAMDDFFGNYIEFYIPEGTEEFLFSEDELEYVQYCCLSIVEKMFRPTTHFDSADIRIKTDGDKVSFSVPNEISIDAKWKQDGNNIKFSDVKINIQTYCDNTLQPFDMPFDLVVSLKDKEIKYSAIKTGLNHRFDFNRHLWYIKGFVIEMVEYMDADGIVGEKVDKA